MKTCDTYKTTNPDDEFQQDAVQEPKETPPSNKCPHCGTNGAHYCPADIARS